MSVRDWLSRRSGDDGSDDSDQWWQTTSFKGHPDEGLFHYRLSSAPEDGALIGSWYRIAEAGSAGAWGPFPPHGGQTFEGPLGSEATDASDDWGARW